MKLKFPKKYLGYILALIVSSVILVIQILFHSSPAISVGVFLIAMCGGAWYSGHIREWETIEFIKEEL